MSTSLQTIEPIEPIRESIEPVRARGASNILRRSASVLFGSMRTVLFLVLYWLRLPVVIVARLISVPMLFAFLFSLWAFPERHVMVITLGVTSFAAFALMWLYDSLLMLLSPTDVVRIL